jgi:hypothetical protein
VRNSSSSGSRVGRSSKMKLLVGCVRGQHGQQQQ